jgi:hypothetical protein
MKKQVKLGASIYTETEGREGMGEFAVLLFQFSIVEFTQKHWGQLQKHQGAEL